MALWDLAAWKGTEWQVEHLPSVMGSNLPVRLVRSEVHVGCLCTAWATSKALGSSSSVLKKTALTSKLEMFLGLTGSRGHGWLLGQH